MEWCEDMNNIHAGCKNKIRHLKIDIFTSIYIHVCTQKSIFTIYQKHPRQISQDSYGVCKKRYKKSVLRDFNHLR